MTFTSRVSIPSEVINVSYFFSVNFAQGKREALKVPVYRCIRMQQTPRHTPTNQPLWFPQSSGNTFVRAFRFSKSMITIYFHSRHNVSMTTQRTQRASHPDASAFMTPAVCWQHVRTSISFSIFNYCH